MSAALTGRTLSPEHRAAIAKSNPRNGNAEAVRLGWAKRKGQRTAGKGKPKSTEHAAAISRGRRAYLSSLEHRLALVEHALRVAPGRTEFLDRHGRAHFLRSEDERRFAEQLDRAQLTWWYERDRWLLSTGEIYVPDFCVAAWETYVELKGKQSAHARKARCAMAEGHPVLLIKGHRTLEAVMRLLQEA